MPPTIQPHHSYPPWGALQGEPAFGAGGDPAPDPHVTVLGVHLDPTGPADLVALADGHVGDRAPEAAGEQGDGPGR